MEWVLQVGIVPLAAESPSQGDGRLSCIRRNTRRSDELCSFSLSQSGFKPFDFEAPEFGRCGPLLCGLTVCRAFRLHPTPSLFIFTGGIERRLKRGILRFCGRGHPSHHRYAWQNQGSRQGYSGHDAAFQGLDDNGRLYAVSRTRSAYGHQLDLFRVGWYWHYRAYS